MIEWWSFEDAERALAKLNGCKILGQPIRLERCVRFDQQSILAGLLTVDSCLLAGFELDDLARRMGKETIVASWSLLLDGMRQRLSSAFAGSSRQRASHGRQRLEEVATTACPSRERQRLTTLRKGQLIRQHSSSSAPRSTLARVSSCTRRSTGTLEATLRTPGARSQRLRRCDPDRKTLF